MVAKDGKKPQEEAPEPKMCPFLNSKCILGDCALYVGIRQQHLGLVKTVGACAFVAQAMMSSSNQRQPPVLPTIPDLRAQ